MKYSEFEREVESLGFQLDRHFSTMYVDSIGDTIISVAVDERFMFDCDWGAYRKSNEDVQEKLYELTYQLAKTPLTEREEEKKYNVIFPVLTRDRNPVYMSRNTYDGGVIGIDWSDSGYISEHPEKYAFTEQEIKDIDERYLAFKVEVTPE